jgi:hypothetical protein
LVTGSLNVAVMLAVSEAPVADVPGVRAVRVAAGPVTNVHELVGRVPAGDPIPASLAVYLVSAAKVAVGFSVATRVVALYVTAAGTEAPVVAVPSRIANVVVFTVVTAPLNVAVRFPVWLTANAPEPGVLAVIVGRTPGAVGVTTAELADLAPSPTALVAATSKLYAVPFVNPLMTVEVAGAVMVTVRASVNPVKTRTEYPVIAMPLLSGAVQRTVTDPLPAVGTPMTGTPGRPAGVTLADRSEAAPVLTGFTALTSKV